MAKSIRIWPVLVLALVLAAAESRAGGPPPLFDPEARERAEREMREGIERLIKGLEEALRAIPRYGPPEINEHGDIVIPRRNPPAPPPSPRPGDQTVT